MLDPKVCAYLDTHRESQLESLCALLRFASIANVKKPDGCRPCAAWLMEHLQTLGFETQLLEDVGQPNVFGEMHIDDALPTLLIYGHYDVQPAEPLDKWVTPPFEPAVRDGSLYARGANDDKGQFFTHLMAVEAWVRGAGKPPVNLKVFLEGEEEIGSPNIEAFLATHGDLLAADALVVSDTAFFAEGVPSITEGLRGLCSVEVQFHGPSHDVHSGIEGGMIVNPVNALAALVAKMHDENGAVTIPGFYDDVLPVCDETRDAWQSLPFDADAHAERLGVDALAGGETAHSPLERNWARPTLDCNGIYGGYQGPGDKTIIPTHAGAKITMRLVAHQDPEQIVAAFQQFVAENTPAGIRAQIDVRSSSRPVLLDANSPAAQAGHAAMEEAFGLPPVAIRCGASVPITEVFQRVLGLDAVLLGVGLPTDRLHSPNEHFRLDQLYRGAKMAAAFLQNLAETLSPSPPEADDES